MPPQRRDVAASRACCVKYSDSSGNTSPSTTAAAAEIVECPDVYVGKLGVGIAVTRPGIRWNGRAVQNVNLHAQHSMNASAMATLRNALARAAVTRSRFRLAMRSFSIPFQIAGGDWSAHL